MRNPSNAIFAVAATVITVLLATTQVDAQVGKSLVINRFLSDPDNIETHVVISDVDGVGPNIKITIYNDQGKLVYERYEALQAFGKLNYNPLTYLNAYQRGYNQNPKFSGTVRIESDGGNLVGQYWEMHKKPAESYKNIALTASDGAGYDRLVCQHFVSDRGIDAAIVVSNVEPMRPVTVDVKFYSDEGGLVATENRVIEQSGVVRIDPFKATKGVKMTGTAYIVVVGAGKITGEYWQASEKEQYQVALPLEGVSKIR
jgi:hypothetical protein